MKVHVRKSIDNVFSVEDHDMKHVEAEKELLMQIFRGELFSQTWIRGKVLFISSARLTLLIKSQELSPWFVLALSH